MHAATLISDFQLAVPAVWAWFTGSFAKAAGTTLITSIWESAVIVCALEISTRVMPRISAAQRFSVWALGFALAAALPLLPLMHFGAGAAAGISAESRAAAGSGGALLQLDARWGMAIAALWLAAAVIRGADLLMHSVRLRRLWKAARPVDASERLASLLQDLRGGRVAICTTEMLDRPSVIGFWWPRILIPTWLITKLTPGELEQIVLHEAEHLRRRDDWTNLAQKLAVVIFPLNPALAWMEHRLCREREMACDEGVVRITNAPRAYAACLTSLAERGLERRAEVLSLGAWHKRSELVHRVHGILLRRQRLSRAAAVTLLGVVGCALAGGSVEMARCPQLVAFVSAQKQLAMTPERQQQLSELLARENTEAKMSLPAGYHAVRARVVMPDRQAAIAKLHAKHQAGKTAAATSANAERTAKADVLGDRVNEGSAQQQWIVMAAWEQVQTVSRPSAATSGDAVADYVAGAQDQSTAKSSKINGQGTQKLSNQSSSGYTVTQLIVRFVPASPNSNPASPNSNSAQPATWVHDGWFVIQL